MARRPISIARRSSRPAAHCMFQAPRNPPYGDLRRDRIIE
jgi:hypothetical protein